MGSGPVLKLLRAGVGPQAAYWKWGQHRYSCIKEPVLCYTKQYFTSGFIEKLINCGKFPQLINKA